MQEGERLVKRSIRAAVAAAFLVVTAMPAAAVEATPHGRLHLDYGAHDDDDGAPIEDGFLVRRARLGVDLKFDADWSFEVAYDFVDAYDDGFASGFKDVMLKFEGWKPADLFVGQFKVPFGLEALESSNNRGFVEPSLPTDAFTLSRRLGAGFASTHDRWTIAAMGFGDSIGGGDNGAGVAARFTATPIAAEGRLLHLGAAAVAEWPRGEVKLGAWPESRVADIKFVKTGGIDGVGRIDRFGIEAAWQSGPLLVQAEWMRAAIRRGAGEPTANLDGWYVAGSWILTGQQRAYRKGVFKGVPVGATGGAWELTARFSRVDLDGADIRGGEEDNFTLGLVYYVNPHLRFMVNGIKVRSLRRDKANDPNLLVMRMQLAF